MNITTKSLSTTEVVDFDFKINFLHQRKNQVIKNNIIINDLKMDFFKTK